MAIINKLKRRVRDQLEHVPGGRLVVGAYHRLALARRRAYSKLNAMQAPDQPDPDLVYWIDPARIILHTNYAGSDPGKPPKDRVFHHQKDRGRAVGGDWDISSYRFDDLSIVQAIYARVQRGAAWEDTPFYQEALRNLAAGKRAGWQIESGAGLEAHCARIDKLIASIRANGYRRNSEVALEGERKGITGHPEYSDEISVNIGRNGEYLFQDGRHRLAVAKALGVERVPVKVLVRHLQWVEFRQYVRSLSMGGGASARVGELYQSPIHPDLRDIPAAHACEDRWKAIKAHVAPGQGNVLDVGCNLGYFCHGLEDLGYTCHGVEYLPQVALAADRIRIAEGKRFKVITNDLFIAVHEPPLRGMKFDIVLALNIFHHFIKKQETHEKLRSWLRALDADVMIFEPHLASEPQMAGAYANYDAQGFVQFILDNSCLNRSELIHTCQDGRSVYRLSR